MKAYANLPPPEREQVIVIIEGETYSWNRAENEVSNDTELGKKILKKLEILEIL